MDKKNITIIGLGGVGGYFGFKLNESNTHKQAQITFLAKGITYEIVKSNGLTLLSSEHTNSITKPDNIIQNISDIIDPDLVIICVKEYDLENVCTQLVDVINEKTILLPLMNGADIYDRIRKIIKTCVVLPSCVYVASHIKEKGFVEHKGITGKIIIGRDIQHLERNIDWVTDMLNNSGADIIFKDNSLPDIWTKFIFIASFGLVSTRYNKSIGQVCEEEPLKIKATEIMQEIKLIADKKGIVLQENIIEDTFKKAATFPFHTPTSLQLDINLKKQNNELELFAGAIIKFGRELNIETSKTKLIYDEIINTFY